MKNEKIINQITTTTLEILRDSVLEYKKSGESIPSAELNAMTNFLKMFDLGDKEGGDILDELARTKSDNTDSLHN